MKEHCLLEIENPRHAEDNLADLLCWWEGFIAGHQTAGVRSPNYIAENGILEVYRIKEKLHAINYPK